jgi:hypothetical protein
MSRKSSKNTTFRVLALSAVFIVLLIFTSKIDILTNYAEMVFSENSFAAGAGDSKTANDSLRQDYYNLIAGFWEHSSGNLYDRIELLDNGIIWQYTERKFEFPYNKTYGIDRVSHSFLSPVRFDDENFAMSNLRVIREVWFMPDTCFGNSFYDVVANTFYRNDTLFFDSIPYTRYKGELKDFFPTGALDLLGLNPKAINIAPCKSKSVLPDWLRDNIIYSFDGREIPFDALKFEQEQLLKNFYVPYSLSRAEGGMLFEKTYGIDLKIEISPNGSVGEVWVKGKDFVSQASKMPIINEVKRWRFPTDGENPDTVRFVGKFVKKQ